MNTIAEIREIQNPDGSLTEQCQQAVIDGWNSVAHQWRDRASIKYRQDFAPHMATYGKRYEAIDTEGLVGACRMLGRGAALALERVFNEVTGSGRGEVLFAGDTEYPTIKVVAKDGKWELCGFHDFGVTLVEGAR